MKTQPVIIKVERIEGDNRFGFSLTGSSEFLNQVLPFVTQNLEFICARILAGADENEMRELAEGSSALINRQSYEGTFVSVNIINQPN